MTTTVTIQDANIILNGINLKDILAEVYAKGKDDGAKESTLDKVTFITLSKELEEKGIKISSRTLSNRAKQANLKIFTFNGNKLAIYRKDVKHITDC